MQPFIFSHTFLETPTYYVAYLLAFLGAILLGTHRARAFGLSAVRAVDLGMISFVTGLFGARVFHIVLEAPAYYWLHPIRVFYLWQGGFVLYGGLIMGVLGGIVFLRHFNERLGSWADLAGPCMILGIAIGRIGCLGAGCCHGAQTDWIWGMTFTDPRSAALLHIMLHPTQILEIAYCGIVAWASHFWIPRPSKNPGNAFVWTMMACALFRFWIEFLRGDEDRGIYFEAQLSTSQFISIAVIVVGLLWILFYRPKRGLKIIR